ncbi:unnamed protein product [Amoebophrya sp. A25]|nr:unnamed protein product [Amoebophrya sp. A25]|eukprot:GSA25T00009348001.1
MQVQNECQQAPITGNQMEISRERHYPGGEDTWSPRLGFGLLAQACGFLPPQMSTAGCDVDKDDSETRLPLSGNPYSLEDEKRAMHREDADISNAVLEEHQRRLCRERLVNNFKAAVNGGKKDANDARAGGILKDKLQVKMETSPKPKGGPLFSTCNGGNSTGEVNMSWQQDHKDMIDEKGPTVLSGTSHSSSRESFSLPNLPLSRCGSDSMTSGASTGINLGASSASAGAWLDARALKIKSTDPKSIGTTRGNLPPGQAEHFAIASPPSSSSSGEQSAERNPIFGDAAYGRGHHDFRSTRGTSNRTSSPDIFVHGGVNELTRDAHGNIIKPAFALSPSPLNSSPASSHGNPLVDHFPLVQDHLQVDHERVEMRVENATMPQGLGSFTSVPFIHVHDAREKESTVLLDKTATSSRPRGGSTSTFTSTSGSSGTSRDKDNYTILLLRPPGKALPPTSKEEMTRMIMKENKEQRASDEKRLEDVDRAKDVYLFPAVEVRSTPVEVGEEGSCAQQSDLLGVAGDNGHVVHSKTVRKSSTTNKMRGGTTGAAAPPSSTAALSSPCLSSQVTQRIGERVKAQLLQQQTTSSSRQEDEHAVEGTGVVSSSQKRKFLHLEQVAKQEAQSLPDDDFHTADEDLEDLASSQPLPDEQHHSTTSSTKKSNTKTSKNNKVHQHQAVLSNSTSAKMRGGSTLQLPSPAHQPSQATNEQSAGRTGWLSSKARGPNRAVEAASDPQAQAATSLDPETKRYFEKEEQRMKLLMGGQEAMHHGIQPTSTRGAIKGFRSKHHQTPVTLLRNKQNTMMKQEGHHPVHVEQSSAMGSVSALPSSSNASASNTSGAALQGLFFDPVRQDSVEAAASSRRERDPLTGASENMIDQEQVELEQHYQEQGSATNPGGYFTTNLRNDYDNRGTSGTSTKSDQRQHQESGGTSSGKNGNGNVNNLRRPPTLSATAELLRTRTAELAGLQFQQLLDERGPSAVQVPAADARNKRTKTVIRQGDLERMLRLQAGADEPSPSSGDN